MTEYRDDPCDMMRAMVVGSWAREKHIRLNNYINASRAARRKYLGPSKAGATYIDPFCGPGRSVTKNTDDFFDGGAVAAWKTSVEGGAPFSAIYIGDLDPVNVDVCSKRLKELGAPVHTFIGQAHKTTPEIAEALNKWALHFAFLDPFNLGTLHISIINALSQLKRMDILLHVSAMDLQRNLELFRTKPVSELDYFAPGWREHIEMLPSKVEARGRIIEHWKNLVRSLDMHPSAYLELISGERNQPLYWLTFISRSNLAEHLWNEVRQIVKQNDFGF